MGEEIVAGMNLMGYDAMAIGPYELELGASTLRQRVAEAEFPMLSANVLWSSGIDLVGERYIILQVGSFRVGVIGLTRVPDSQLGDFTVLEPEEVLAVLVPEVDGQADTVIVLTNLSYRSALKLAQTVPGIDLVIAALPRQLPDRAVRASEAGSLVISAEQPLPRHTGRRVGRLEITIDSDGALKDEVWRSIAMGPEIADDLDMRELLSEY
jgi:2',3'-cyclic-nucleotide 2'-phosphodiesterase (5'-nucleotidase family)